MSKRPELTILLFERQGMIRADFSRRDDRPISPPQWIEQESDSLPAQRIDDLENDQRKFGRTTLVLDSELWTQQVSLPRMSVADLAPSELASALRFEVETLCGIDADRATLAYLQTGSNSEDVTYWVTVAETHQYESLLGALVSRGVRSVFLAHPAGIGIEDSASAAGDANPEHKEQVEFWPNLTGRFFARDGKLKTFSHLPLDADAWRNELADSGEATGYLIGRDVQNENQLDGFLDESAVQLARDEDFQLWSSKVKQSLARASSRIPLIEKPRRTSHPRQRLFAKALLALIALIGCLLNWQWLNQRQTNIANAAEVLRKPAEEKSRYDQQISKVKRQAKAISAQAEQIEKESAKVQFLLQNQSDRLQRLMVYLRDLHTDDILIQEILSDDKGISIVGISLSSDSATLLATRLRELTLPMGWKANPASQLGEKKMVNGGPWKFTILLEDVGPDEAPVSVAQFNESKQLEGEQR